MRYIFITLFLGLHPFVYSQDLSLIPYPNKVSQTVGSFEISHIVSISSPKEIGSEVCFLNNYLKGKNMQVNPVRRNGQIKFIEKKSLPNESYTLSITKSGITIAYADNAGAFYAFQTLRQLAQQRKDQLSFPLVEIEDQPAFSWRAFMLDEGRYFKGKVIVKNLLDEMAALKMNVFHWHLTEEVGWRLEVKKYPRLTQIGGYRDSCRFGPLFDPLPHSGYYTQQDIAEIVRYASERHIEVIPEIDMPGHASAAIAAYPILGTHRQPFVMGNGGDVINVADSAALQVIKDILDEVIAIFPSRTIHIGGDEVGTTAWAESNQIKNYMDKKNIQSYGELQISFTNYLSDYLASKGRRMMGWNEITGDLFPLTKKSESTSLAPGTLIHFWEGDIELVRKSVERGFEVINSDRHHTYLDYPYEITPLHKSYGFNPIPTGLSPEQALKIKGLGCQMWGEKIRQTEDMYFFIFPRIAAYAECGWTTNDQKDFSRFEKALQPFIKAWRSKGYFTKNEFRK